MNVIANEDGRRIQLARFGYRESAHAPEWQGQVAEEWLRLRDDFQTSARPTVPDLDGLPQEVRGDVNEYVRLRSQLDELMDKCDAIHREILSKGAKSEIVERYAVARDAYEDAVEEFGEHRETIEGKLAKA